MDDQNAWPDAYSASQFDNIKSVAANAVFTTIPKNVHPLGVSGLTELPGERSVITEPEGLEGIGSAIKAVRDLVNKVAKTNASVLILGDSGTGKEVAAREIHQKSLRRNEPFIPVNCGAIPADLLESELFGHEKGAFTGALSSRPGRFERAEGGTLFLDEIGDMSLDMQVKLLRVLQEKTFERVGSNKTRIADVRIIAATHRNLEERILENKFREDLFYRLNVFPIEMPTLCNRREDIPLLLRSMLNQFAQEREVVNFSEQAIQLLQNYDWPGNVRELANVVERICILCPGETIDEHQLSSKMHFVLPKQASQINSQDDTDSTSEVNTTVLGNIEPQQFIEHLKIPENGVDLKDVLTQLELHFIKQAIKRSDGVIARAARLLGLGRTTLVEKLRKFDIARSS